MYTWSLLKRWSPIMDFFTRNLNGPKNSFLKFKRFKIMAKYQICGHKLHLRFSVTKKSESLKIYVFKHWAFYLFLWYVLCTFQFFCFNMYLCFVFGRWEKNLQQIIWNLKFWISLIWISIIWISINDYNLNLCIEVLNILSDDFVSVVFFVYISNLFFQSVFVFCIWWKKKKSVLWIWICSK